MVNPKRRRIILLLKLFYLEMINMDNTNFCDCGDCIHFDGNCCINILSSNYGRDIINADDCDEFEEF